MRLRMLVDGPYALRRRINSEETFLRRTFLQYCQPRSVLLDVGCGYSRFYEIIRAANIDYWGVDSNPQTVAANRSAGRNVIETSALQGLPAAVDIVLFSHVIEHLDYMALLSFLNTYLPRLRPGGHVIILTPLIHAGFYDDFDHVKPYNPAALRQIFCRSSIQTQAFTIPGMYRELGLWLKRDPLFFTHRSGRWTHLIGVPAALSCALSFGLVGRLTGYGMVLQRVA